MSEANTNITATNNINRDLKIPLNESETNIPKTLSHVKVGSADGSEAKIKSTNGVSSKSEGGTASILNSRVCSSEVNGIYPLPSIKENEKVRYVQHKYIDFSRSKKEDILNVNAPLVGQNYESIILAAQNNNEDLLVNEAIEAVDRKISYRPFPIRLHEVLRSPDAKNIIKWLPHGRSIIILDVDRFTSFLLPKFYKQKIRYSSFQRQLQLWGFLRLSDGSYYNQCFLRGMPDLIKRMVLTTRKGKGGKKLLYNPKMEPDLYLLSRYRPLPYQSPNEKVCLLTSLTNAREVVHEGKLNSSEPRRNYLPENGCASKDGRLQMIERSNLFNSINLDARTPSRYVGSYFDLDSHVSFQDNRIPNQNSVHNESFPFWPGKKQQQPFCDDREGFSYSFNEFRKHYREENEAQEMPLCKKSCLGQIPCFAPYHPCHKYNMQGRTEVTGMRSMAPRNEYPHSTEPISFTDMPKYELPFESQYSSYKMQYQEQYYHPERMDFRQEQNQNSFIEKEGYNQNSFNRINVRPSKVFEAGIDSLSTIYDSNLNAFPVYQRSSQQVVNYCEDIVQPKSLEQSYNLSIPSNLSDISLCLSDVDSICDSDKISNLPNWFDPDPIHCLQSNNGEDFSGKRSSFQNPKHEIPQMHGAVSNSSMEFVAP